MVSSRRLRSRVSSAEVAGWREWECAGRSECGGFYTHEGGTNVGQVQDLVGAAQAHGSIHVWWRKRPGSERKGNWPWTMADVESAAVLLSGALQCRAPSESRAHEGGTEAGMMAA